MLLTTQLTIGQITFILRVAVQILALGGLFLISLIILANAPRVASVETHDVINRVVGRSTANVSSAKWIVRRLLGRNRDPVPSTRLLLATLLLLLYGIFATISDIGFIGFHACTTAGPSTTDFIASLKTDDSARTFTFDSLVNGTSPATVNAYRCDATEVISFGPNVTLHNCTDWHNSTYAEPDLFRGLNTTDTGILMPRALSHDEHARSAFLDLNSFYSGPGFLRVEKAIIKNGMVIVPDETGLRAVIGIPQLDALEKVQLPKAMAVEVEVGCMAMGIYTQQMVGGRSQLDIFATNESFRKYTGPEYFRDVLSKTVDEVREHFRPLFVNSTVDPKTGFMLSNESMFPISAAARISSFSLSTIGDVQGGEVSNSIPHNCTNALKRQFGLPTSDDWSAGRMCNMLYIGGSFAEDGKMYEGASRMMCAAATQVNMVSATVEVDSRDAVTLSMTRLPSDLNHIEADWWDVVPADNDTMYMTFTPYERFTLAENPAGATEHYIVPQAGFGRRSRGPGSGANAITSLGDFMLRAVSSLSQDEMGGISLLPEGYDDIEFTTARVTRWLGQTGGSVMTAGTMVNGWAARDTEPITVLSTGGQAATCYHPAYALGFMPLVLAAVVVICWTLLTVVFSSLFGTRRLEDLYGGMNPLANTVCPGYTTANPALLVWENYPSPHLNVLLKGQPVSGDASGTALGYVRSEQS